MTKRSLVALLAVAGIIPIMAMSNEKPHHRVVFDSSAGEDAWEGVLNNVENLRNELAGDPLQIEVVAYGRSLGLVLQDGPYAARVARLQQQGIVFAACANTMKRQRISAERLVPGVIVVPSGVAEVVRKQEAGWSYVKAGS